jgi:hypothetical protein
MAVITKRQAQGTTVQLWFTDAQVYAAPWWHPFRPLVTEEAKGNIIVRAEPSLNSECVGFLTIPDDCWPGRRCCLDLDDFWVVVWLDRGRVEPLGPNPYSKERVRSTRPASYGFAKTGPMVNRVKLSPCPQCKGSRKYSRVEQPPVRPGPAWDRPKVVSEPCSRCKAVGTFLVPTTRRERLRDRFRLRKVVHFTGPRT